MVVVGLLTAAWAAVAIPARATYNARTTADEPQYLLTALSLAEDASLDVSDEIADRRFVPFHEVSLDPQTERLAGGREVSPHDPLLPVLLAPAMALPDDVGWVAAKATLAALAGLLSASLVWVAVRRFDVPVTLAAVVVACFALTPPLVAYGTQVYPELPAALVLTWGLAVATGPARARPVAALVVLVSALPWLGVKYAPVAAALAVVAGLRWGRAGARRPVLLATAALVVSGALFLLLHRHWYGGWTVYATGDHFSGTGELSVVGTSPDHLGRTRRLAGLLVDRSFGLVAWMPGFLLAVPALGALLRRRPPGWEVLVLPLAAGWATATWVALTMHGWWWPGRQVVVVVPCLVLTLAWGLAQLPAPRRWATVLVVAAAYGAASWAWLVWEATSDRRTLVVDFMRTANPAYRVWRSVLPEGMRAATIDDLLLGAWALALVGLAWWGWHRGAGQRRGEPVSRP